MRRFLAVLAVVAAAACGSSGPSGPPIIIVTGGVAYFIVTSQTGQDTTSTLPNTSVQLKGVAYDGSLNVVTGTWVTNWTSGNSAVATVNGSGLVDAVAPGSAYIFGSIHPDSTHTFKDSTLVIVLAPQ